MISLFRKIRKSLLEKNKVTRYLIYALGEILLVVIGIFIALQLNISNEKNKEDKEATKFITRLLEEVTTNIGHVKSQIDIEDIQIESSRGILAMFNKAENQRSSSELDSLVFNVLAANSVEFNTGTLVEGQNTGKIAIINSDELRLRLYNLPSVLETVRRREAVSSQDVNEQFATFLYEHYNYRNMDNYYSREKGNIGDTHFKDYNNLVLFESQMFENLIDNRFYNNKSQKMDLQKLLDELQLIEKLINQELQND